MKNFKEEQLREIINNQFRINGYDVTYDKVKNGQMDSADQRWFEKYTTTEEKEEEFREWLRGYLKPYVTPARLDNEVDYFILGYGLKTKNCS